MPSPGRNNLNVSNLRRVSATTRSVLLICDAALPPDTLTQSTEMPSKKIFKVTQEHQVIFSVVVSPTTKFTCNSSNGADSSMHADVHTYGTLLRSLLQEDAHTLTRAVAEISTLFIMKTTVIYTSIVV